MVVINDKSSTSLVLFPKNFRFTSVTHNIVISSEASNEKFELTFKDRDSLVNYYTVKLGTGVGELNISQLKDGEYKYVIDDCTRGYLIIGSYYKEPKLEHTKVYPEEQKYIYYDD